VDLTTQHSGWELATYNEEGKGGTSHSQGKEVATYFTVSELISIFSSLWSTGGVSKFTSSSFLFFWMWIFFPDYQAWAATADLSTSPFFTFLRF
ncbi:hypothetical protein L9F63_011427, partial [Diploptera punctata]